MAHNLVHRLCRRKETRVLRSEWDWLPAGEGGQMIFEHYRELVTEKGAKAWFAITPESTKALREKAEKERRAKIVAFPAKLAAA